MFNKKKNQIIYIKKKKQSYLSLFKRRRRREGEHTTNTLTLYILPSKFLSIFDFLTKLLTLIPSHLETALNGLSALNVLIDLNAEISEAPAHTAPKFINDNYIDWRGFNKIHLYVIFFFYNLIPY